MTPEEREEREREKIRAYVEAHPLDWPPLSDAQRARIRAIVAGADLRRRAEELADADNQRVAS